MVQSFTSRGLAKEQSDPPPDPSELGDGPADVGATLTAQQRQQLADATAAGLQPGQELEQQVQAVLQWADQAAEIAHRLEGILAARLLPGFTEGGQLTFHETTNLSPEELRHFRQQLDRFGALAN